MTRKQIVVVGGGIAGLSAAYDLLQAGHDVTVYEAADQTGGLATGFKDDGWDWPLEKFYHHLFRSDADILQLVEELGFTDRLFWPRPTTSTRPSRPSGRSARAVSPTTWGSASRRPRSTSC